MSISERIKIILSTHKITASQFAEELGIQRSAISHLISGRNKPSIDVIERIVTKYPRVDAHWLITGKQVRVADKEMPSKEEKPAESKHISSGVECIVMFYKDGTYKEYFKPE